MKRILLILALLMTPAYGQWTIGQWTTAPTSQAATPTFSPVAGAVSNPTTVTASSTTTGAGCTMYFDTSSSPATAQTTYSVTTGVTLYAQVRGCSGYSDSAVGSAAYTIAASHGMTIIQTLNCSGSSGTACTFPIGITAGNSVLFGYDEVYQIAAFSGGTLTFFPTFNNGQMGIITGITGGTTTFTLTASNPYANFYLQLVEVSGVNSTTPLDATAVNGINPLTDQSTTGSVTTTGAYDSVCGFSSNVETGTSYPIISQEYSSYSSYTMFCSSAVTPGTYNPSFYYGGGYTNGYYGTGALILQ